MSDQLKTRMIGYSKERTLGNCGLLYNFGIKGVTQGVFKVLCMAMAHSYGIIWFEPEPEPEPEPPWRRSQSQSSSQGERERRADIENRSEQSLT